MGDYKYVSKENLKGYQKSWNQTPHQYQANRVFSRSSVGTYQYVDWKNLRETRLAKMQEMMKRENYAALLLTAGENIHYATGTDDYVWKGGNGTRYALVFPDKDPILYETVGPDTEVVKMYCPWIKPDRLRPAITYRFTSAAFAHQLDLHIEQIKHDLAENGVKLSDAAVAVDGMDFTVYREFQKKGVTIVPVGDPLTEIRVVKSADEIELIKIAGALTQTLFYKLRHEWIKPGVTEREIVGKAVDFYVSNGMTCWGVIVASGSNTNPLHRSWSDKIIQQGEMVFVDIGVPSYQGYGIDVTRCWPVAAKFTPKQKEVYRQCHAATYAAINKIKPGATSADVAGEFPPCAVDDDKTCDLLQVAHSVGMGFYEGYWMSRGFSLEYPMTIRQDMVLACETYVASPEGPAARLEDTVVVTDTGYSVLSQAPFEEEALQ